MKLVTFTFTTFYKLFVSLDKKMLIFVLNQLLKVVNEKCSHQCFTVFAVKSNSFSLDASFLIAEVRVSLDLSLTAM